MSETSGPSIFCICSYDKGQGFLREAARLGAQVTLLTVDGLRDGDWPKDVLAGFYTMPANMSQQQIVNTVMYLARTVRIDRMVALDEFDVENVALIREHMRLPGLGQTKSRIFRDKLSMRSEARRLGIPVPEFTGVFHYDDVRAYMRDVPGPWLLKPRMNASAMGIKPIEHADDIWPILDRLGDEQTDYVLERFVKGAVFHCEGITWGGKLLSSTPGVYGKPPMQTMHQGGVSTTRSLPVDSGDGAGVVELHERLMAAFELPDGVTHSEFVKADADGTFYFLETAARVGGAYIADMVEFATGINPWVEWARMEVALAKGEDYSLPAKRAGYSGAVISLARQYEPDLSGYSDQEIVLRLHKPHHAGVIVASESAERVKELVEQYSERFVGDFLAVVAPPEKRGDPGDV